MHPNSKSGDVSGEKYLFDFRGGIISLLRIIRTRYVGKDGERWRSGGDVVFFFLVLGENMLQLKLEFESFLGIFWVYISIEVMVSKYANTALS